MFVVQENMKTIIMLRRLRLSDVFEKISNKPKVFTEASFCKVYKRVKVFKYHT